MAYAAPSGSYIRDIPGYGRVAFSPDHHPLGIVLNNGNPGSAIGTWDALGSPPGGAGGGGRGGFRGHGHSNREGHGSGNRGGMGIWGRGAMRPIITQITRMGGGVMEGGNIGGTRLIVNGRDVTDQMGGGGWPRGFGGYPGGWEGHNGYPITRPVDPFRDFVPGGPRGTPGHNPISTYPGAPIDPRDDARDIISKKLRDAPEKVRKEALPEDGKDCSICYTPFWEKPEAGKPEAPVKLRSCGHVFGENCLNEWVQTNNSCPSCRKQFPVVRAR